MHKPELQIRVELGVMAIKEYFILLRVPEWKPHHQIQFSVIQRIPVFHLGVRESCLL